MDTPLMHTVIDNLTGDCFPRLMTDLVSVCFLMFGIYLPNNNRNREYLFTFLMFNVAIFHIALLLNKTEMSLGAAFGLFAESIVFVRDIANLRVFYHEQQVTICKESSNYTNS